MLGAIIGSVAAGLIGKKSSDKATRAQTDAANRQIDLEQRIYDENVARFAPYYDIGTNALRGLNYEVMGGDMPEGFAGFQASPGYQFRLNEGQRMLEGSAAAAGNLYSGNTLRALTDYGQGMASNEYGNYIARLGSLAGMGQAAAGNQANAGANFAAGAGQAIAGLGNAQAAGAIGGGNAINQGIGNALGAWQYAQQSAGGNTAPNWLFNPGGGGSWMNGMFS